MSNLENKNKNIKANSEESVERYKRIYTAINNLKQRPESRRGPFILSDEDLNTDFQLK